MRKATKENLLDIFKTIREAHEIAKGFIDRNEYENTQNLLADCQDTALQIAELIEESEGEDFVTVSLLQNYCKTLYEAVMNLSDNSSASKVKQQLDKAIDEAENSAKNDIEVKFEIVFMPYKASMWDSLESVWRAANEDPDCNAYVVPIPYYDRLPDHSFGEFHYEGKEFPENVPVIDYNTYDPEQHHPDVIYIHNPYDGNNFVTSVAPRFYSKELKKYTEHLVYIPYFVTDESRIKNNIHYATTPAVINADKVVVQSETMKRAYTQTLLDKFGHTQDNIKLLDQKILAMGSPKYDAVQGRTRDSYVIPDEWKKLIGNKKVVLYNTHLNMLMAIFSERFLPKLRSLLEYFRQRDDVVLWWRPHPLMIPTARSMNPKALDEFLKIANEFKAGKWGIYDDSPELERAIAMSDAYYGMFGSVYALYKLTGKPMLISDVDTPTEAL